jgi:CrcB protein
MIWLIALGSAIGGVCRYLLGGFVGRSMGPGFPLGTLIINVTGSFLVCLVYRYTADSAAATANLRAFLTVGFCGGYTTFSTFSYETVKLLEDDEIARAAGYAGLSVVASLAAALAGIALGRELLLLRRG